MILLGSCARSKTAVLRRGRKMLQAIRHCYFVTPFLFNFSKPAESFTRTTAPSLFPGRVRGCPKTYLTHDNRRVIFSRQEQSCFNLSRHRSRSTRVSGWPFVPAAAGAASDTGAGMVGQDMTGTPMETQVTRLNFEQSSQG